MQALYAQRSDLSKLDYSANVRILLDSVREHGLGLDVLDPMAFHPVPYFAGGCHVFAESTAGVVQGVQIPSVQALMSESCAISQTWWSWNPSHRFVDHQIHGDSIYKAVPVHIGLKVPDGWTFRDFSADYFQELADAAVAPESLTEYERSSPDVDREWSEHAVDDAQVPIRRQWRTGALIPEADFKRTRLCRKTGPSATVRRVLSFACIGVFPTFLEWEDYCPAIAAGRGVAPADHVFVAELIFNVERELRQRLRFGPQSLSVSGQGLWQRGGRTSPGENSTA